MKQEIGWEDIERDDTSVVTVGTFDGVHRGHQAILDYLLQRVDERGGTSTLISFDPHPRSVVHGQDVPLLTTVEERGEILNELGLDRFVVIPFTDAFSSLTPREYVTDVLVEGVGLCEITVGYDHRFGKGREGDVDLLREMGAEHGFDVDVIPAQEVEDHVVSSSGIRDLLAEEGAVREAAELLGRRYRVSGVVERGEGRGRKIGFPTANLRLHPDKLVPAIGVYATLVEMPGGATKAGMMNVGRRPTFDGMDVTAEVHVLDFEGDLYDRELSVQFVQRLREERKFESADALAVQLSEDKQHCKRVIEAFD
jgi:riboflavin kinase/FMN adenylyltransferase